MVGCILNCLYVSAQVCSLDVIMAKSAGRNGYEFDLARCRHALVLLEDCFMLRRKSQCW